LLQNREHGCCDFNIDQVSTRQEYRLQAEARLAELGVHGVDLSTCAVPQAVFDASEIEQFEAIEARARHFFLEAGYKASAIAIALQAQIDCAPSNLDTRLEATRAALNARQAVKRYANHLAVQLQQQRTLTDALQNALRALETEQAHEAEARAHLQAERVQRAEAEDRALRMERDNRDLRARVDEAGQARLHIQTQHAALQVQHAEAEQRALRLERDGLAFRVRVDEVEQARLHIQTQHAAMQARLAELLASRSWRLTAPLRWLRFQLKLLRIHGVMARLLSLTKKTARAILGRMFRWAEPRPRWRRTGAAVARLLGIDARLRALHQHWWLPNVAAAAVPGALTEQTGHAGASAAPAASVGQADAALSPRARQIRRWLDDARRDHLGGR
jgi:hypothetical protein